MQFLKQEPLEVYRAHADSYLTSHQLAVFRRCPLLYYKQRLGLVAEEDRPAFLVGRALHTLVLGGPEQYEAEYAIGGPINPRTGAPFGPNTKAFAAWVAEHGRPVLTLAQDALTRAMANSIRGHPIASKLLEQGVAEGVARADYCAMPCQVRIDWFTLDHGIVEIKTCDDLDWFEVDARGYGYVYQVAFYEAVLRQLVSWPIPIHFIAVEKKEPYRCGVWRTDADALARARRENEAAIERLRQCMETNVWPTGYEECRILAAV